MFKILIVDDDRLILESTAEILEGAFTVLKASNASEAVDLLAREDPDCIVSDIVMPGESGIDFIKTLRAEGDDRPVIIMTGFSTMDFAEQCANLKTSGYIKKPINSELLINMVRRATVIGGNSNWNLPAQKKLHPKLLEVKGWIEKNIPVRFSLIDAAKANGISVSHLSRLYKNELAITFSADVNRMRVERAMGLLRSNDASIDQVREAVGYENFQHFYKNFKKYTGLTPRQYGAFR